MSMSALALTPPLREGDRLTRDEFLRRWEAMPDLKSAELIGGIVHMPSPVSIVHSDYHSRMSAWLVYYVTATRGSLMCTAGTWLMSAELVVEISHTTSARVYSPASGSTPLLCGTGTFPLWPPRFRTDLKTNNSSMVPPCPSVPSVVNVLLYDAA